MFQNLTFQIPIIDHFATATTTTTLRKVSIDQRSIHPRSGLTYSGVASGVTCFHQFESTLLITSIVTREMLDTRCRGRQYLYRQVLQ
jgi:hypothetical protein